MFYWSRPGCGVRVFGGSQGFEDHFAADKGQEPKGYPVVNRFDGGDESAAQKPAGYGHDELKDAEKKRGPQGVPFFKTRYTDTGTYRNGKGVHGKTQADKRHLQHCYSPARRLQDPRMRDLRSQNLRLQNLRSQVRFPAQPVEVVPPAVDDHRYGEIFDYQPPYRFGPQIGKGDHFRFPDVVRKERSRAAYGPKVHRPGFHHGPGNLRLPLALPDHAPQAPR
jgi:hypothetical protein